MRYQEIITELFDKTAEWKWVIQDNGRWQANFQIGDIRYYVYCNGAYNCSISFDAHVPGMAMTAGITGTGNAYEVFSTVMKIIVDFVKERNPESFAFESTKHNPSRVKLYRRMCNSLKDLCPNYSFEESEADNPNYKYVTFTFTRKDRLSEKLDATITVKPLFRGDHRTNDDVKIWDISSKNELVRLLHKFSEHKARAALFPRHLIFWEAFGANHNEVVDQYLHYGSPMELRIGIEHGKIIIKTYGVPEAISTNDFLNSLLNGLSVEIIGWNISSFEHYGAITKEYTFGQKDK